MAQVGGTSYYCASEIAKLAYIRSALDRAEARSVLRQADAAFHDCRHTDAENEEAYGLLARYATDSARGAAFTTHSLELWSAHLDGIKGYMWVYYSYEAFDAQGNRICGSWKIPALWTVEKDETGTWVVVHMCILKNIRKNGEQPCGIMRIWQSDRWLPAGSTFFHPQKTPVRRIHNWPSWRRNT